MADLATLQMEIQQLEESGADSVPMATVKQLITLLTDKAGTTSGGNALYSELGQLAKFLNEARKELFAMQQDDLASAKIPDAASQLNAVLELTEEATGKIMSQCEQIENLTDKVEGTAQIQIRDAITQIYEALSFQDITGQRLQKIITVLQEVERQILRLVVVFGLEQGKDLPEQDKAELASEAELLNGPQLPGEGLEQDQIDDILNKLL